MDNVTRSKMKQARGYIERGKWEEARRVLVKVKHPKAQDWLQEVEARLLAETQSKKVRPFWLNALVLVIVMLVMMWLVVTIVDYMGMLDANGETLREAIRGRTGQ